MFEGRPQTRVQIAGTQQFCRTTHRRLKDHTDFDVIQSFIIEDHDLVGIVEQLKPDILVLHTQLVTPFCPECLKGLEGLKVPPHMVVVSPHHDPDLIMAQNCPATRATLLSEMGNARGSGG